MTRYLCNIVIIAGLLAAALFTGPGAAPARAQDGSPAVPYTIVDTGQVGCYDANGTATPCPDVESALFGQDANYTGVQATYLDNGDGTITDLNTGLVWQQDPGDKVTWEQAAANAESLTLGGYDDWRMPTIKELYSLMDFNGVTGMDASTSIPYLDTDYFIFEYGDTSAGERVIDAQFWSSTRYVSTTMGNAPTAFGVNFADGRIKGYPIIGRGETRMFVRYVRGNPAYGVNDFRDNGDGTITDQATGLTWTQADSGSAMLWGDALAYCESLDYAGYSDWRLPDAKEMQSIVDYTRSPDTTGSAAIDPLFQVSAITDDLGQRDYPYFWTSTTHLDGANPGERAVYIAFGEAQGYMALGSSAAQLMDVHGAGAQRSDPKSGDPANYAGGLGPQGDVIRIYNYARCVRGGDVSTHTGGDPGTYPQTVSFGAPPQGQSPQGQQPPARHAPPAGGPPPHAQPPGGNPPPRR